MVDKAGGDQVMAPEQSVIETRMIGEKYSLKQTIIKVLDSENEEDL